ncbi:MAG: ABC transporter ATP-binding protein, partial [Acidobacteriota bacterium]
MDAAPVVEVHELSRAFGRGSRRRLALDGVTLTAGAGEVLGLVGPNGAGKTTLLSCVLGLIFPTAGRVRVFGGDPCALSARRRLGYLPERLVFPRRVTARRFLQLQHALAGRPRARRATEVEAALTGAGLGVAAGKPLRTFSRGMLQRLGMAMATMGEPSLLVLDEPTSGMDPVGVRWVADLVGWLRQRGATVLLSSHQLDQVARLCDRVAFLRAGVLERIQELRGDGGFVMRLRGAGEPLSPELVGAAAASVGGRFLPPDGPAQR